MYRYNSHGRAPPNFLQHDNPQARVVRYPSLPRTAGSWLYVVGQASFPRVERPQRSGGTGDRAVLPYTVTATDKKGIGWSIWSLGVWKLCAGSRSGPLSSWRLSPNGQIDRPGACHDVPPDFLKGPCIHTSSGSSSNGVWD